MRKALNDNPVAQIAVLGVLAVVVGFLLLTRMSGNSGGESSPTSTTASDAAATPVPAPAIDSATSTPPPIASTSELPPAAAVPPAGSAGDATVGEFVAGPGLPASVVKAYRDNKTVVLLVLKHGGIDDDQVRQSVEGQRGRSDVALFITNAGRIARYSRITQGVNVSQVPALIALRPRHLTQGTPTAIISYGFRGPESVDQAISDALYKGPKNLPYYPR